MKLVKVVENSNWFYIYLVDCGNAGFRFAWNNIGCQTINFQCGAVEMGWLCGARFAASRMAGVGRDLGWGWTPEVARGALDFSIYTNFTVTGRCTKQSLFH